MKSATTCIQVHSKHEDAWNSFVAESPQGSVFCTSWWLNAVTHGQYKILALMQDGTIVAGIPLAWYLGKINEPPLTRTLGPLFKDLSTLTDYDQKTLQRKWVNELLNHIPLEDVAQFCTSERFTDWLPFRWRGYQQTTRYTYLIHYKDKTHEDLWNSLNENRKRDIKKAKEHRLRVSTSQDPEVFYQLVEQTYQRQDLSFRIPLEEFLNLDRLASEHAARTIFMATNEGGQPLAAAYFVEHPSCAYYLLGGSTLDARKLGAQSLVIWEAMKHYHPLLPVFNFGGSEVPNIEFHFRTYGGILTPYFHIFNPKHLEAQPAVTPSPETLSSSHILTPYQHQYQHYRYHLKMIAHHTIGVFKDLFNRHKQHENLTIDISVVTPCYNHGKYLDEMLESVLSQTLTSFEVIIVDDGSMDDTPQILQRIRHPRVKIIHTFHLGVAHARNLAIAHARGRYILNLDADDTIAPTLLEQCVTVLDQNPMVGIVYADVEFFGAREGCYQLPPFSMETMLRGNCIVSIAAFRKEDWAKTQGYSSELIHGYEDFDFWLSILRLGREVYKIEQTLAFYRVHHQPEQSRSGLRKQSPFKVKKAMVDVFRRHKELYEKYPSLMLEFNEYERQILDEEKQLFANPQRPVFSIVTPTSRRPQMLLRNIRSIQQQSFAYYEHIIVDDAGDAETADLVKSLNDPKIVFIQHDTPKGAAGAYNTGMKAARGLFINFLDDDDEYLPDILEKQLECFQRATDRTGFIWTGIIRVRDTEQGEETIREQVWPELFPSLEQGLMVSTAIGNGFGLSIKRECVDRIGYYDESLMVGEDTEFMIRLSASYSFRTVPEILVKIHHHGEAQLTHSRHQNERLRSYKILLKRHKKFLMLHWDSLYMHHRVFVKLFRQTRQRWGALKTASNLLAMFPARRILWLDLFTLMLFGKDYIDWKNRHNQH